MAATHVHTIAADLYSEGCACGSSSPVGANSFFMNPRASPKRGALPFGFWSGGFSSTAGYVPGNEAQACGLSDCATLRRVLSKGRDPFLSGRFRKVLRLSPASLSAATRSVVEITAACYFTRTMRCRAVPLLPAGHDARERRDRVRIIQPIKSMSSRKYFNYLAFILAGGCGKFCGKHVCNFAISIGRKRDR